MTTVKDRRVTTSTAARAALREHFPHLRRDVPHFAVRDGEDPWTVAEISAIAAGLLADRARLTAELAQADADLVDLLRNSGDGAGDDQADYGSSSLEREQELTVVLNTRDLLEQTDHAIERIREGTYGTCEETGLPIGKARLAAFPRATLSIEAKARSERR